ncbi:hypothetical protein N7475_009824 [Penicillium sp. IBT 31633x]|nr:hypothetical protein N7475_009824 [Penicillium sp. IBT 31633x]
MAFSYPIDTSKLFKHRTVARSRIPVAPAIPMKTPSVAAGIPPTETELVLASEEEEKAVVAVPAAVR